MTPPVPSVSLSYRPGTRSTYFDALLRALLDDPHAVARLSLHTREVSDPAIALLDAWASMADVIAFYQERIVTEGYLRTARQPESVLALAGLIGTRPRPGVAATTYLAYSLHQDPGDNPVVVSTGLRSQTVPGPGEQPQVFQTERELVARPSWNLLTPVAAQPVPLLTDDVTTTTLSVAGTANRLSANDLLVLRQNDAARVLRIRTVTSDPVAARTTFIADALGSPQGAPPAAAPASTAAATAPAAAAAPAGTTRAADLGSTLDALTRDLEVLPTLHPVTPTRTPEQIFGAVSETTPRLLAALHPAVSAGLYSALASTTPLAADSQDLTALRVVAAPFGAQAPPQQLFDDRGLPDGTREWALGGARSLTARLSPYELSSPREGAAAAATTVLTRTWQHLTAHFRQQDTTAAAPETQVAQTSSAIVHVAAEAPGQPTQRSTTRLGQSTRVDLGSLGSVTVTGDTGSSTLTIAYANRPRSPGDVTLTAVENQDTGIVTITADDGSSVEWDPSQRNDFHAQLGPRQLDIEWTNDPAVLTLALRTPLPLTNKTVLDLDGRYDQIVPGSVVVVTQASDPNDADLKAAAAPPIVTKAAAVDRVSIHRYGQTNRVTRLVLRDPWIGDQRSLADVRTMSVHTQADPLVLLPVPIERDVSGDTLDLDGLHAGLDPGRLILLTGDRTDLPDSAVAPGGEAAAILSVNIATDPNTPGASARTVLTLAKPLTYRYRRSTVKIFGNVVPAHQGQASTVVLGGGRPEIARQSFTLPTGPTLNDGLMSSLVVRVDGLRYQEVDRITSTTDPASYLTGLDAAGSTTITFAGPLPAGKDNVVATYRSGFGGLGNARAHQISQLIDRPLAVTAVDNPLPASGGSNPDTADTLRSRVPIGLASLGHAVSVDDYAELARAWPGVGKAVAATVTDSTQTLVHVTVAATTAEQLSPSTELVLSLHAHLQAANLEQPVLVSPADLLMAVLHVRIIHSPQRTWPAVAADARTALLDALSYDRRGLDEDIVISRLVAAVHTVAGVLSCTIAGLTFVSADSTAADIGAVAAALAAPVPARVVIGDDDRYGSATAAPDPAIAPRPARLAYLSSAVPDTLVLEGTTP